MHTGLDARLDRISTDGSYFVVPMDHGITMGAVSGLKDIESTIDGVTRGGADAVLTQKGIAPRVHPNKNEQGYIVHLNASTTIGPDEDDKRMSGTVEEAVRAGADAVSLHINVGSTYEPKQLEDLARVTDEAARLGIPVLAMAYARGKGIDSTDPESLGHAVRFAEEFTRAVTGPGRTVARALRALPDALVERQGRTDGGVPRVRLRAGIGTSILIITLVLTIALFLVL